MHNGVKLTLYNKTAATWAHKMRNNNGIMAVTNTFKTPRKSHFSTRASSQKPALPLPKLSLLDQEDSGETKFFHAYFGKG